MTKYQAKQASIDEKIALLCNSFDKAMSIEDSTSDGDETDDDALLVSANMTSIVDTVHIKAHLDYYHAWYGNSTDSTVYAISDSGADACIVGQNAHVLSYTGRSAVITGYDPSTTMSGKVPIVTALLKVKSNAPGEIPILLKVHE